MYIYKTKGVCSSTIKFQLDGNKVKSVEFEGGCSGNLKAISKLVEGMSVDEIASKLEGLTCGFKQTSCSDQLIKGIKAAQSSQVQAH